MSKSTRKSLVSVVVVTKDRKKDLIECLESFRKSSYKPSEIIVVDNNSKPSVESWLPQKYSTIKLITLDSNVGAAEGRNIGFNEAKGEYILFIDDDAYVDRNAVGYLVSVFEEKKGAGIVQPLVYDKQKKNELQGAGHDINLATGRIRAWGVKEKDRGQHNGIRNVPMCGCVWMVRREVFNKIGNYDEDYFIPYEDSDFSLRARKAGFELFCTSDAKAWHQGPKKTFVHPWIEWLGITSPERAFRVSRNKLIFMRKHSPFPFNFFFFLFLLPVYTILHSLIILGARRGDILKRYWLGLFSGIWYIFRYNKYFLLKVCLLLMLTFALSFLTFKPSFSLALFGDDWIVFYGMRYAGGPGKVLDYTSFRGYFGPYTIAHYLMGAISYFWGYSSEVYYYFSFLFRYMAALGLAGISFYFTRSLLASFVTAGLFSVWATGLESTNWVFNMSSYLAIFFLSLSILFALASSDNLKKYFLSLIFLVLAVVSFPQRTHGAFLLIAFIGTVQFLFKSDKKRIIGWFIKMAFLLLVTFSLVRLGTFGGTAEGNWFLGEIRKDLDTVRPYFVNSFITTFGNMIVPNTSWEKFPTLQKEILNLLGNSVATPRLRPLFLLFVAISLLISYMIKRRRTIFLGVSFILGLAWVLYFKTAILDPLSNFHHVSRIAGTALAAFFLIWSTAFLIVNLDRKEIVLKFGLLLLWPLLMIVISWTRSRFYPLDTYFRYMVVAGASVPIMLGVFTATRSRLGKVFFLFLAATIGLLHFDSSRAYFDNLMKEREVKMADRLWTQLLNQIPDYKPSEDFSLFYFEGHGGIIYNVFTFGFIPRIGLIYDVPDEERNKLPLIFDDPNALSTFVKKEKISSKRIYAFRVERSGVTDIKKDVLKRLKL